MENYADLTLKDGVRPYPTRCIVYPDGRIIHRQSLIPMEDIKDIICNGTPERALEKVFLHDGHVMMIHEYGQGFALPFNKSCTAAWQSAQSTNRKVFGIAAILPDEDFLSYLSEDFSNND